MADWRPVAGYEGLYEVSDEGEVRRLPGTGRGAATRGRVVKPTLINSGYLTVGLWSENRTVRRLLHRMVASAFLGDPPAGHEVNHRNLDKGDNRAANLEYMTRGDNLRHRAAAGIGRGERNGAARVTEAQVREIRQRHADGEGYKRIARDYGLRWESARDIIKRRTWDWLA